MAVSHGYEPVPQEAPSIGGAEGRNGATTARPDWRCRMMLDLPNELEAQKLLSQGVSEMAMLEPETIRAGNVRFLDGDSFEFADDGQRALIFRIVEFGLERDLVAWSRKLKKLATWRGVAFALGQEAIWNPATYFMGGALEVHRTPLDWLKADRAGICIVQPRYAYSQIANVRRLRFADEAHARLVRDWLKPPAPPEFLVEVAA